MPAPLDLARRQLAELVIQRLSLDPREQPDLEAAIRVPEAGRGDLSLPCFNLAKAQKCPPPELAKALQAAVSEADLFESVRAVGPYLNVDLKTESLAKALVPMAREPGFGENRSGQGKTVVIDYSSPNIAKPLAFHHLRSTVIGAAIGRLHAASGWKVVGINYLGDWGKQFGLLATGFQRYGDPALRSDAKHLVEVYVKANRDADVGRRKAAIQKPSEIRALIAQLTELRDEPKDADPKLEKKRQKRLKSLEKKLSTERGLESGDPLSGIEAFLDTLEAEKAAAEAELPMAEARDQEARAFLKRMEEKDPEALAEWQEFRDTSIAEFEKVYQRMGVRFSLLEGESFYQDVLQETLDRIEAKPGLRESEGAMVIDMPTDPGDPPALVRTRDGTTLYITRDIAAAMDRHARFQFDRALYVVAADQRLHFKQLFRALGEMGFVWAESMEHVPFGRVHGMSTRRGNVVFLDEVLEEAVQKAKEISESSGKIPAEHLSEAVEAIGVGAVVFGDLSNLRTSDYTFRWEEVLNFSGHTAPYVQFSHARACSILEKGGGVPREADLSLLQLPEERSLLMALASYPDALLQATEAYEPSLLTRALLQIAQSTAAFLTAGNRDRGMRVLNTDPALQAARLQLIDAVRNTLAHGLGIIGCKAPTSM